MNSRLPSLPVAPAPDVRWLLAIVLCLLTLSNGCREKAPPPTLVVHFREGSFALRDPSNRLIAHANRVDEVVEMIHRPLVRKQIVNRRLVLRVPAVLGPHGDTTPPPVADELVAALLAKEPLLIHRFSFEYEY